MQRVASLYLPEFAIERVRRIDSRMPRPAAPPPEPIDIAPFPDDPVAKPACSVPRGGGWRPGARWARNSGDHAREKEAAVQAIAAMPAHQRPPMRELGRRSEQAPMPFRAMPRDEAGGLRQRGLDSDPYTHTGGRAVSGASGQDDADAGARRPQAKVPGSYDREGAFWQTGRALGGVVKRAVDGRSDSGPRRMADPGLPPLALSTRDGARILAAHACPAARALGIRAGLAMTMARAMVPGLDVRDADPDGVAADLHALALFAQRRWTPGAAVTDADGVWLDLTGVAHLHGGEARFCTRVLRFCARLGLSARIAVAGTAGAAYALARFAHGRQMIVETGAEAQALAPLPIAGLRLESRTEERLRRLGVETIADLIAMPRAPLARRFGSDSLVRIDQALGRVAEPIQPVMPRAMPSVRLRFVEPIATAESIGKVIGDLVALLAVQLSERGEGVRRLELRCERVDAVVATARVGTATPTRDPGHLRRLLLAKVETIDPGFGIEAMVLRAPACQPLGALAIPGELAGDRPVAEIATLVDLVMGRSGTRGLYRLAGLESDVPERSVARVRAIGMLPARHAGWMRPLRLLDPAEPVQVIAELPDQPPRRFIWRGRAHLVRCGDGPERIYGEWWRRDRAQSVRDYFQVEDEAGARFWLYRRGDGVDARTGDLNWYLHGVFA